MTSKNFMHIGFTVLLVGVFTTTIGHYSEYWALGYVVSGVFALLAAMIYAPD